MPETSFRSVYSQQGRYDELLLPHIFGAATDVDLVAARMKEHYGEPGQRTLAVCDLGCGTGRVTAALEPYAASLVGVDSSEAMIRAFTEEFPNARTVCADLPAGIAELESDTFDVIGAFWSLSYPIMAYFERLDAEGITENLNEARAMIAARELVNQILRLLKPGGRLIVQFFDSDSPEQQVVSRLWERLAPPPGGSRSFSRLLLLDTLTRAARRGLGRVRIDHFEGAALAKDANAARSWFLHVHAKTHEAILNDPRTRADVETFITAHERNDGTVHLPAGVYLIEFTAAEADHV
ncbi:class I SAM-dependent methyltransferase [Glycomyces buryatensis]|nr:class I SAM-dependent methyltransferase [Glycomyces buryatensis]